MTQPTVFRSKKLDHDGSRVEVLTDGSVRISPPPGAPLHFNPVTLTREEFLVVQGFVPWCWKDLPRPPKSGD